MKDFYNSYIFYLETKIYEILKNYPTILKRGKLILYSTITISSLLFIYLLLGHLIFENDPLQNFFSNLNENIVSIIFYITSKVLSFFGWNIHSHFLTINLNDSSIISGITGYKAYRKIMLAIIIIWISPSNLTRKIKFSGLYGIFSFIAYFLKTVTWILLSQSIIDNKADAMRIGQTFVFFNYLIFSLLWIKVNKEDFNVFFEKIRSNLFYLIKKKYKEIISIVILIFLFNNVVVAFISFDLYIKIILSGTQKILELLNYDSFIEGDLLWGNNGSIRLVQFCLGINTMITFSSIIWITGKSVPRKLFFILIGLISINILNFLRLVLLFINIEKHGSYDLAMKFHDMFNYIFYIFIFILWIIWLEKFTDIWVNLNKKNNFSNNEN